MRSNSVRDDYSKWVKTTFGEAVKHTFWKNSGVRSELADQLKKLGIFEKPMDGYSVQGLQKTEEGGGVAISYTATFFEVEKETNGCNPIDYLYLLVKKAMDKKLSKAKTTGLLARSMRTFASLLRDKDFAYHLEREIDNENSNYKVERDPIEDAENHTDVLVKAGHKIFRIWLFQHTSRGLPHNVERLTSMRGRLPQGIHVLCPFKSDVIAEQEQINRSIRVRETRLKNIEIALKESKKGTKKIEDLSVRKEKYSEELKTLLERAAKINPIVKDEATVLSGWYCYSTAKVKRVFEFIKEINAGKLKPKRYDEVFRILNAPREYLSEISAFEL